MYFDILKQNILQEEAKLFLKIHFIIKRTIILRTQCNNCLLLHLPKQLHRQIHNSIYLPSHTSLEVFQYSNEYVVKGYIHLKSAIENI